MLLTLLVAASTLRPSADQQDHVATRHVVAELLAMRTASPADRAGDATPPGPQTPPPDDAPLALLGDYWARRDPSAGAPTAQVRQRLLDVCDNQPELLTSLFEWLPETPEAGDRVKSLLDRHAAKMSTSWNDAVTEYLKLQTRHLREQLVADARLAEDADHGGYVDKSEELEALARIDWTRAEPILRRHAAGAGRRTAALAIALLYRHAVAVNDRSRAAAGRAPTNGARPRRRPLCSPRCCQRPRLARPARAAPTRCACRMEAGDFSTRCASRSRCSSCSPAPPSSCCWSRARTWPACSC
jgi:hypothetical protein